MYAEHFGKRLQFVVEHMAEVVFDFCNCGSVELNPLPGKSPRKGILC